MYAAPGQKLVLYILSSLKNSLARSFSQGGRKNFFGNKDTPGIIQKKNIHIGPGSYR